MNKTVPKSDERAVSPVIGVILMVAITVLLGAIVSMLVLDMGQDIDVAPQASFGFEMNPVGNVTITHEGGDKISANDLTLKVDDDDRGVWNETGYVAAGDWTEVNASSDQTVRIIWSNDGDSAVIARYTVP